MTDEDLKERARGFLWRYADSPQVCLYCNVIHAANCPKEDAVINSMAAFASSIQEEARQQITSLNAEVAEFRADCIRLNGQLASARAQGMREAAEVECFACAHPELFEPAAKDKDYGKVCWAHISKETGKEWGICVAWKIWSAIERAAQTPPASHSMLSADVAQSPPVSSAGNQGKEQSVFSRQDAGKAILPSAENVDKEVPTDGRANKSSVSATGATPPASQDGVARKEKA